MVNLVKKSWRGVLMISYSWIMFGCRGSWKIRILLVPREGSELQQSRIYYSRSISLTIEILLCSERDPTLAIFDNCLKYNG